MRFSPLFSSTGKPRLLVRFIIVGIVNTTFSYLVYAALIFVGVGFALANLAALILGIPFSFKTQGRFVFRNADNRLLGRFMLAWAVIYLCAIAVIAQLMTLGLDAYSAGAIATVFSAVLSFVAQKYYVFRRLATQNSGGERF